MNLREAVNLYLAEKTNPHTKKSYRSVLDEFVQMIGGIYEVEHLTPVQMLAYKQHLLGRNLKAVTIDKHFRTIKALFNWLVKLKVTTSNPASVLHIRLPRGETSRDKAMKDDELVKILDVVKRHPRNNALVRLLADSGCRASDAANLLIADLDLDNCRALVIGKHEKRRFILFADSTVHALRRWLIKRPPADHDYVFSYSNGTKPLTPAAISAVIRKACRVAGIEPTRGAHSLRHRKGYQFADQRIAPTIAAAALGHDDVKTTLDHYYPADLDRAHEAMRTLALTEDQQTHNATKTNDKIIRLLR